jgi:hypothetical protein
MIKELCIKPSLDQITYSDFQIGSNIASISDFLSGKNKPSIAIICESDNETDFGDFRKALYAMSFNFPKGSLVDLGNVKGGAVGITEIVEKLKELNKKHGARFEVSKLLIEMAKEGKKFY